MSIILQKYHLFVEAIKYLPSDFISTIYVFNFTKNCECGIFLRLNELYIAQFYYEVSFFVRFIYCVKSDL